MGVESSSCWISKDVAEAQAIMEGLPLAKQNLMDHDYIAVGPLLPLACSSPIPSARNQSDSRGVINTWEEFHMSPAIVFQIHLVLGYVPWLLAFSAYLWPRLKTMDGTDAQRAIATLHSFRFFGLVFIVPGVVGTNLPADFATFAAYGDFATGLLAMLALLTVRRRTLFGRWSSLSMSSAPSTSSSTTITAISSAFRRWQGNWVPPTRSRSSMCPC